MNDNLNMLALTWICLFSTIACTPQEKEVVADTKRPNILFAIADDASFPHMGAYGTKWVNTPAFDRVAREGLLFMRAYTPNAKCAPSRACILTGRNSWQLEEAANHSPYFPAKFKTFVEALAAYGYQTGYTAKGWAPGDPGEVDGKKRELTGTPYNKFTTAPPTTSINSNDYARNFEDFLNQKSDDQPFCFWYGSTEPHRRYEFRSGISKGGKKIEDIDNVPAFWPDTDTVRADMLDYAYEIEYFDEHLQQMIDLLEERGELDNTIIVVTADNGMPFPRIKGQEYEYSNHLPLAIMWKNGIRNPGRRIEDFVSFIDFTPTFLEAAEIPADSSSMTSLTGKSLTNIFYSEAAGQVDPKRNAVIIGKERHDVGRPHDWGYPIRGIVTTEYLYLHNFEPDRWPAGNPETGYLNTDGSPTKTLILNGRKKQETAHFWKASFGKRPQEELYQISKDPACTDNLALHPEYQTMKDNLKSQLFDQLKKQGDPRMFGNGHTFDEYEYAGANSRNFYERYMHGEEMKAGWVNETDFEKNFDEQ
ncbi:sulfatase family protein [Catalinimonas niigatensis]|uniref:sulfatase family protein n=1 Tax=Catalinimonas niigatensis TaxID=1397264 RepID=UPI0026655DA6|nr:sulfatase [Catalinimonas niigatensis]WPP51805.1 sulfatase [Catalinimonas niigatensis]